MSIPDFQTLMLPLLEFANDRREHPLADAIEYLSTHFKLTETERKELLPSGKQPIFDNRVGWTRTHLKKAGLFTYPARGRFQITQRGLDLLKTKLPRIDMHLLKQFPEYVAFIGKNTTSLQLDNCSPSSPYLPLESVDRTPDEVIAATYQELRVNLAQELLDRLKSCSPAFFERFVVELLVKMGYGGSLADAGHAIGRSGDEGIDGIIKEDLLGLDVIYIQAKRWNHPVGRPEIQQFVGALEGKRARKGIFITTAKFSEQAKAYVPTNVKVVLIDGDRLANYAIDVNLGVAVAAEYQIKRLDFDYFEVE